jgi:hypothetical protein
MIEIGRAAGASPRQLQQAAAADPVIPAPNVPARRKAASSARRESPASRSRRKIASSVQA